MGGAKRAHYIVGKMDVQVMKRWLKDRLEPIIMKGETYGRYHNKYTL